MNEEDRGRKGEEDGNRMLGDERFNHTGCWGVVTSSFVIYPGEAFSDAWALSSHSYLFIINTP